MTEKPEDWKNYEDFAAGIATNRLPNSDHLTGQTLDLLLENDQLLTLVFISANEVIVTENGHTTQEWCEVVLVAKETYFVDLTLKALPNVAQTLIISLVTSRILSIRSVIRAAGEVSGAPRVAQDWVPGIIKGRDVTGAPAHESRDLIGLRALYTYSPNHVYEHIYLSSKRYCWQNLKGVQYGHGDTDLATTFEFAPNQYVFGFREFIIPVASVFFYNFDDMHSTGKFLGETKDGRAENKPAGALIQKLSMTFYPSGIQPV